MSDLRVGLLALRFGAGVLSLLLLIPGLVAQSGRAAAADLERKLEMTPKKERAAILTRALTWLTGGAPENDYVSVGRLANYFGFVHFRISSGHSIQRGRIGQQVYGILDGSQQQVLLQLLDGQWPALETCQQARVEINRAIEGLLIGEPCSLRKAERLGQAFGQAEAELGVVLAKGFAAVVGTLTTQQRQQLVGLYQRGLSGEPTDGRLDRSSKRAIRDQIGDFGGRRAQELWNLSSRLLTWVAGNPGANDYDTVGKPSQHFGFVALRVETSHGVTRRGVANAMRDILTSEQEASLGALVAENSADFDAFFAARARINRELENGLAGERIELARVRAAGREQGLAEARMTWRQAQAFLELRTTLRQEQAEALAKLRAGFDVKATGELFADDSAPTEAVLLAAGQRVYALCAMCHLPNQQRGIGPALHGVVGRRIASVGGYTYSPALKRRGDAGETWTLDQLDAFLTNPRKHTPGTWMPFSGIASVEQRKALMAWLGRNKRVGEAAPPAAQSDAEPVAKDAEKRPASSRSRRRVASEPSDTRPQTLPEQPNFVFILFEGTGAGWASTSVAMDDRLPDAKTFAEQTPTLRRLAEDGMRFSSFYMSSPRCTPSRASLLTGMNAAKLGITYVNSGGRERSGRGERSGRPERGGRRGRGRGRRTEDPAERKLDPPSSLTELPAAADTIAEVLNVQGYATAHFGKWHIGRARPGAHGFDEDDGANTNQGPERGVKPNPEQAMAITDRGIAFVRARAAAKQPFYLQLSHYGGGTEGETSAEVRRAIADQLRGMRGKSAYQAAILREVDDHVARLVAALDELELADSTYVFVSFDHGASGRGVNEPLRGGKGSVHEGGVRVPFLVRGPGVSAGACSHVRASSADILPTLADLAGVKSLPSEVEGGSLVKVLRNDGKGVVERPVDSLVVHFPHYDLGSGPASAIYIDDYKLIRRYEDSAKLLYHITDDPGETRDLAAREPRRVAAMEAKLAAYLKSIGASLPKEKSDR